MLGDGKHEGDVKVFVAAVLGWRRKRNSAHRYLIELYQRSCKPGLMWAVYSGETSARVVLSSKKA